MALPRVLAFMEEEFIARLKSLARLQSAENPSDVQRTVRPLLKDGVDSLDSLLAVVEDPSKPIALRSDACWVLGLLGDKRATQALLQVFHNPVGHLHWEAAKALISISSKRVVKPLIKILEQSDYRETRAAAAYTLGFIRDPRAVEPLVNTLMNVREDMTVRSHAAEALGYIKDPRALRPLITVLKDPAADVRFWSAFALSELGDRKALPGLVSLSNDHTIVPGWWSVGKEAAWAIEQIKAKQNAPVL